MQEIFKFVDISLNLILKKRFSLTSHFLLCRLRHGLGPPGVVRATRGRTQKESAGNTAQAAPSPEPEETG